MKHLKTYEGLFDFFKKKEVNNNQFDIEILKDLLESDLDGVNFWGIEILSIIKFEDCRFKSSGGKPKLTHDGNWFGDEVNYSSTGYRGGSEGILLYYDINALNNSFILKGHVNDDTFNLRDIYLLSKKIFSKINKDRMTEFGIGYCINNHHFIGDGIVFYKL